METEKIGDGPLRSPGMAIGSPSVYINLSGLHRQENFILRYTDLEKDRVLFEVSLSIGSDDPLQTVQLAIPLPHILFDSFDTQDAFRCDVVLSPEHGGGFSAECTNLIGVISEGDTEEQALANIADAFRETVRYYISEDLPIPFGDVDVERCSDCRVQTLVVSL